ncbi:MAG: DUF1573 domain-containing protein [Candidatus Latescibacterota bacterium]|nr:MAG: DUF1573 domain-containing protein [Candidatus Latescibacterota bacterium]
MRRYVNGLVLIFVAALFLVSVAAATEEEKKQPNIVIEELRHDLGEVFETDKYKHAFKVSNTGDAELVIESVKPG